MSSTEGLSMAEVWTEQDEATYKPLRNKLLRIQAKARRDKTRKRQYFSRIALNTQHKTKEDIFAQ